VSRNMGSLAPIDTKPWGIPGAMRRCQDLGHLLTHVLLAPPWAVLDTRGSEGQDGCSPIPKMGNVDSEQARGERAAPRGSQTRHLSPPQCLHAPQLCHASADCAVPTAHMASLQAKVLLPWGPQMTVGGQGSTKALA
jgi:hypothetical protein